MRVNLSNPGGYPQLHDVILQFFHALRRLGHKVEMSRGVLGGAVQDVIFGAQCLSPQSVIPPNAIVYNLEQFGSRLFAGEYADFLRQASTVWDYSSQNTRELAQRYGIAAKTVFPGYVPEMSNLGLSIRKDLDVMFYGAVNERRQNMLDEMQKLGLRVHVLRGYGRERDYALSRAKLVVNIHYYEPAILEISRLGYLWANSIPVLCEKGVDTEIPHGLEHACAFVPYDRLAVSAACMLGNPTALAKQGARGFEDYSSIDLTKILEREFGRAIHAASGASPEIPLVINIGSGKNFLPDAINIDILPQWNPDIILDISSPISGSEKFQTARFGEVRLAGGKFKRIIVHDVLEHVSDLKTTMANLLFLLCEGGELDISVPYDLSLGAWQDPTHVRAFNENSWLYYTTWFWYMGWKDYRFEMKGLELIPSEYGKKLLSDGQQLADLARQPRAIDSMSVKMIKIPTTEAEIAEYCFRANSIYKDGKREWQ